MARSAHRGRDQAARHALYPLGRRDQRFRRPVLDLAEALVRSAGIALRRGKIGFQLTLGAGQVHYGIERRDGAQNALDFGGDFVEHASWGTIYSDGTVGTTAFGISELTRLDAGLKTTAGY